MKNALPDVGVCPKCGGSFHVKARTVSNAMLSSAHDELEWKCSRCGHTEIEQRFKSEGDDDDWPASRFQR